MASSPSVRWFIAYRFLAACMPYLSVASLCLAARGLSFAAVLELGALYAIASAALVLPVSAIAQRVGPRRTLIGGALAVAVGAVVAAGATSVATMAVAQVAFAVAAAVDAGADSAYLWTLLAADRDAYRAAEARSTAARLAGGVVAISLGGALLVWSPAAPFLAAAAFALAAAACASRLPELALAPTPIADALPRAARALVTAAGGARWLAIGVASCAVARVMASAAGPLLVDAGITGGQATFVATAAAATAAIAAALTAALRGPHRAIALFAAAPLALAGCAIGLASAHGAAAAALIAAGPVVAGALAPLWRAHLNQGAPAGAPRMIMLALDATAVRVLAAALSLASTGAAPKAGVAALGIVLAIVMALATLRDRRVRLAVGVACAVVLPQLAAAEPAPPTWSRPAPALCTDELTITKPLGAGTTIKFKAMVGATKVVVRPAQIRDAGNFRADVAAYLLAQALGQDAVPYACLRTVPRAALDAVADDALRVRIADEVRADDDGTVRVSVVAWVSGVTASDLEATRAQWRAQLAQATPLTDDPTLLAETAEGSRLAVWDFLIANWDRWSGGNTFRLGAHGRYVWLDNAAGFGREAARTRTARARTMMTTERFSRALVAALRGLDDAALAELGADAGLGAGRVDELAARRDLVLAHVDRMIASYGEDAVLAFD